MANWISRLAGTQPSGAEQDWLGPDGARIREHFGEGAVSWAMDVGDAVAVKMSREVPQIVPAASQFAVLRRATTSTTLRALLLVSGLSEFEPTPAASPLRSTLISTEAVEIVRDAAHRGLELQDILRLTRVGYAVLATAMLDAILDSDSDAGEVRRVSILLFDVVDGFTAALTAAFVDEQRAWEADVSAARLDLVRTVLEGKPVDDREAGRLLGYPLEARHIALIVSGHHDTGGRVDLRRFVRPVVNAWGVPSATLMVPVGAHTLWAWAAFNPAVMPRRDDPLPVSDRVNVAAGQPGEGIEGFRRTHLEARAVERLRSIPGFTGGATIDHRDVDLEALLLADPNAARQFVARYLGPLAGTDPRVAELRSTLRLYLDCDHRLGEVAELKHISRNTVTYRVRQALDLCAHPDGGTTTRLRSALLIRERLADATDV